MDGNKHEYPKTHVAVHAYEGHLRSFFPKPPGLIESEWPPLQVEYLGIYLKELGCQTVLVEGHYIDRDYIAVSNSSKRARIQTLWQQVERDPEQDVRRTLPSS